jgi:hypothetical protein
MVEQGTRNKPEPRIENRRMRPEKSATSVAGLHKDEIRAMHTQKKRQAAKTERLFTLVNSRAAYSPY